MGSARNWATYVVYRSLGVGMSTVPEPVADLAAATVAAVMARRPAGPQAVCEQHITRVLSTSSPVVDPDPEVVRRWGRRTFRAYSRYWAEAARLPAASPDTITGRMVMDEGWEHLQAGVKAGKGVVLALPHVGSWEWGGAWFAQRGTPMTSVAERLASEKLYEWFVDQRRALGLTIVPLDEQSGAVVLQTLRRGGVVGLVCDRDLIGNGVEVEFFGERTTLPAGPAALALRTGAMLSTCAVYSGPGRDHVGTVSPPINTERQGTFRKDVARITQEIARSFETYIRRAPEQWHLFQPNWPSDTRSPAKGS